MGLFFWLLAAGAGYAGYRGCRRLQIMEKDLRREVAGESLPEEGAKTGTTVLDRPASATEPVPGETPTSLEARILRRVREQPGILQTELYAFLPGEKRRALQEQLKDMDRSGVLRRVKEGGTFKLHPGQE